MGLLSLFANLRRRFSIAAADDDTQQKRRCLFETMEDRHLLSASPLHLGAIYIEEDSGADRHGDTFEIMYEGGAPGTQLKRLVIDGDHGPRGLSFGDMIFDTTRGGLGADEAYSFQVVSQNGIDRVTATVADGGLQLILDFEGFEAGEKLVFQIDVDEVQDFDPSETDLDIINQGLDPIASGVEFQGSQLSATFVAPHYYEVSGTSEFRNVYDPLFSGTNLLITSGNANGLSNDDAGGRRDRSTGTMLPLQQQPLPISIAGTVYLDANLNLDQDQGEQGLGGVSLALWKKVGSDYTFTGNTVTTDSQGNYLFSRELGLTPGTYQIRETQPVGLFSVGAEAGTVAGSATGSVLNADVLTEITIPLGGTDGVDYDFAEAQPASIGGSVYVDANNNGIRDSGEQGIAGATVQVLAVNTISPQQSVSLTTDANGNYLATGLAPGAYRIVEVQPLGYFDGIDRAGTVRGVRVGSAVNPGDRIESIQLGGGDAGVNYDFGELLPGSIRGRVHFTDREGNCFSETEVLAGIPGAVVKLRDAQGNLLKETLTDSNGEYEFVGLAPGTYTVEEVTPVGLIDGGDHVGTINGVKVGQKTVNDTLTNIVIGSGQNGIDYDFCEHLPSSIAGFVYHDRNDNGLRDSGEEAIGGATVVLFDAGGTQVATTTSDATGFYKFAGLSKGVYRIVELQPQGWLDGSDAAGTIRGVVTGGPVNPGDEIQNLTLLWGDDSINNNFGEYLPASITGIVHVDPDRDLFADPGERRLSGVKIELLDGGGNVVGTTLTDAEGRYRFEGLRRGTYAVRETQPVGFLQAGQVAGSKGGNATLTDIISVIPIGSGENLTDYNFCEIEPGSIEGIVHIDNVRNCLVDPGERRLEGVTIELIDADGNVLATTLTNAEGRYRFDGLTPGIYSVREIQPASLFHGGQEPGSGGGGESTDLLFDINVGSGDDLVDYNFCELDPGSIEGIVHIDIIRNCLVDPGEAGVAGVTIELLDANGNVIGTTLTDANGKYRFDGLRPGTYAVRELQPAGLFHAGQMPGSGGGEESRDLLFAIDVGSGEQLVDYNFCELPPAVLSGYVFRDGPVIFTPDGRPPADIQVIRDGRLTTDDLRLAGVVLELRNALTGEVIRGEDMLPFTHGPGPIRTVTDTSGFYEFRGLREGSYAVIQVQPEGYLDSLDTPGTTGGIAVNPNSQLNPAFLQPLLVAGVNVNNDAIVRIGIGYGGVSQQNNFSEVQIETSVIPPLTPDPKFTPRPPTTPAPFNFAPPPLDPPRLNNFIRLDEYTPYTGGGEYSWHLSVVNAGSPRGNYRNFRVDAASILRPAKYLENSQWTAEKLSAGKWVLPGASDEVRNRWSTSEPTFGIEDATPLTGDFNGDGVSELCVFLDGEWFIDINGNGHWDVEDLWGRLGAKGDRPVVGDWDGDGKDDIGIFGPQWERDHIALRNELGLPDAENERGQESGVAGQESGVRSQESGEKESLREHKNVPPQPHQTTTGLRQLQHTQRGARRLDLIDHVFQLGVGSDVPIAGDFNGDGIDTIGIYRGGTWRIDVNGDGHLTSADRTIKLGEASDVPVIGDFDGDGVDEIGVFRHGKWLIDSNHNGEIDAADRVFELGGQGDIPIVGDFNGDGLDEPGLYQSR